ncbi:hypothetical protein ES288_D06G208900v1 [Gossypium darwinii]|uniref:50S ribosomal protein L14, chloroplastic n=1 Tax=Gossypium darwinii TaxID=34276 RepID=A0A5D2CCP3_GOSDA|nr:hypothetical protein ES288_D06G208900v1 [Gossypium darwinii]
MIQPQTHLNVVDNKGTRELMCIRVMGARNRRYAHIGDVIIAVIKEAVPNTSLERSKVIRAVIVRTQGNPKGTQIFGVIPWELRQLNFTKIVSLGISRLVLPFFFT